MAKTYKDSQHSRMVSAERRRNAERCRKETDELSQRIAERRAARTSEAIARLAVWKHQVIADNEQRGISLGC